VNTNNKNLLLLKTNTFNRINSRLLLWHTKELLAKTYHNSYNSNFIDIYMANYSSYNYLVSIERKYQ
jgi:hypothetical protein